MKICIKNCTLISMDEERDRILNNMDILIDGNRIIKIDKDIDTSCVDKVIDASGKVVMPGLINTHAHTPMSIFRETIDGYKLQDWLSKKIWPMESKLCDRDIYYASYLTFLEMIMTGTTTVNDMYFMTDNIIKAMKETGIRLETTSHLMNLIDDKGEERLNTLEELINKYKSYDSKLTFNVGIHGLYTSSGDYIDKCIELANKYNLKIHMHFCENGNEINDINNIHGNSPISILKDKFMNNKMILAHSLELSNKDIDMIKNMNISVSHCPVSNLKLGCGVAKINYMLKNNINVSLGTDGQGSGSNMDLFETMKYTALLQKGITKDPTSLPAYEVLKMATINGAKALDMDGIIGSIKEGKLADIIIIDINNATTRPINDLISEIVYNVKGNNVITTIIDGNIVMEDRKLVNDNLNYIYNECENIIDRINS